MRRGALSLALAMLMPSLAAQSRGIDVVPAVGKNGEVRAQGLRDGGEDYVFGVYHALLIGIDEYEGLFPDLQNAVNDVEAMEVVLTTQYGFAPDNVSVLPNELATRSNILAELERIAKEIDIGRRDGTPQNLLIYYAGHGVERQWSYSGGRESFWIPYQARKGASDLEKAKTSWWDWVNLETLKRVTGRIPATHLLIVSDSCFAGGLARGVAEASVQAPGQSVSGWIRSLADTRSKHVFTSSDEEEASDGGLRSRNSVFAHELLSYLRNNRERCVPAHRLALEVQAAVKNQNHSQQPLYATHPEAASSIGQFVFVRTAGDVSTEIVPQVTAGIPFGYRKPGKVKVERVEGEEGRFRYFAKEGDVRVEMVLVPPWPATKGEYLNAKGERVVVEPYLIDRDEVTNARFKRWYNDTGQRFPLPSDAFREPQQPITFIKAPDAEAFARRFGKRLPTEVEWEYAAGCAADPGSGGAKPLRRFPWGDRLADGGRPPGSASRLPAVGSWASDVSMFGVRGMSGGVREWCLIGNSAGADGSRRVIRGGGHVFQGMLFDGPGYEVGSRLEKDVAFRPSPGMVGFRCVLPLSRYLGR